MSKKYYVLLWDGATWVLWNTYTDYDYMQSEIKRLGLELYKIEKK